jgi:predicted RNA-binding protein YlxR (DUF448 family)
MAMGARGRKQDRAGEPDEGPLRLCAVTRAQGPPETLVRFALSPDGTVVPDLARRLPGRGMWITARRDVVQAAVSQRVFARSFKRQVKVPDDLPALVERLMKKRLAEAISLANKAGLLVAGFVKVEEALDRGRAVVLLHASEAAADGAAKLDRKFKALIGEDAAETAIVRELDGAELALAMGRPHVIHAAAAAGGASQRIVEQALHLRNYRPGGSPVAGNRPWQ